MACIAILLRACPWRVDVAANVEIVRVVLSAVASKLVQNVVPGLGEKERTGERVVGAARQPK